MKASGPLTSASAGSPVDLVCSLARSSWRRAGTSERLRRLYAKTPRGRRIEIGGIWEKQKKTGDGTYFSLSADTGFGKLNANLGRFPGQDDESLMAVIPWR